jgi:hypothetical protein
MKVGLVGLWLILILMFSEKVLFEESKNKFIKIKIFLN